MSCLSFLYFLSVKCVVAMYLFLIVVHTDVNHYTCQSSQTGNTGEVYMGTLNICLFCEKSIHKIVAVGNTGEEQTQNSRSRKHW